MFVFELPIIMIRCLIITLLIETIVGLILGIREKRDLLNVVLVNIVTNQLVVSIPVFFNYKYGLLSRNICLLVFEVSAFLFEGFIYDKFLKYKKLNGFIISLILNGFSYFIGELINYFMYGVK